MSSCSSGLDHVPICADEESFGTPLVCLRQPLASDGSKKHKATYISWLSFYLQNAHLQKV